MSGGKLAESVERPDIPRQIAHAPSHSSLETVPLLRKVICSAARSSPIGSGISAAIHRLGAVPICWSLPGSNQIERGTGAVVKRLFVVFFAELRYTQQHIGAAKRIPSSEIR